jgi:hypothetical protein
MRVQIQLEQTNFSLEFFIAVAAQQHTTHKEVGKQQPTN